MIKQNKHKKLFYVPGMISLVFIPLFCLYYFYSQKAFVEYGSLVLGLPDDKMCQEIKVKYGFPIPRNYEKFVFNSSEELQKDKFIVLKFSLQKLKKDNDTVNGIRIHLGEHSDYATYIRILNILTETEMPTWMPYKNDIWVLIGNRSKEKKAENHYRVNCGTQDYINSEKLRLQELEKENEKKQFKITFFKSQWPIFVGYFCIVFLNIFSLIKFNKKRKHNQKSYI